MNGTATMERGYDNYTQNILLANYEANFILDGDDGSNNMHAYNNLFVYGQHGTKSTYGGHDIRHFGNMYGYVQDQCLMSNYAGNQDGESAGYNDWYFNNTCIVAKGGKFVNYGSFACQTKQDQWPILGNNTIYTVIGVDKVGLCNLTESDFQTKFKTDLDTTIAKASPEVDAQFVQQAKEMLFK